MEELGGLFSNNEEASEELLASGSTDTYFGAFSHNGVGCKWVPQEDGQDHEKGCKNGKSRD